MNNEKEAKKEIVAIYHHLKERSKDDVMGIDYTHLRVAYTSTDQYRPYGSDFTGSIQNFMQAISRDDFVSALASANERLSVKELDIQANFDAAFAYKQLGRIEDYNYHRYFSMGLNLSVHRSGDGSSFESPKYVIDVDEEFHCMRFDGFVPDEQSLVTHEGQRYDVIRARNPQSGENRDYYFNIEIPMKWLDERLRDARRPRSKWRFW